MTTDITFARDEYFPQSVNELWSRVSDLAFMSRALPDLERVEHVDSKQLVCRVRPRLSFLSGSLKLTFDVMEQRPMDWLRLRVHGKGIGAAVVVEIEIGFSEHDGGTKLDWKGEVVSREGLLKPVSTTLIEAAAGRVIDDVWGKFHQALEQEDPR